VLLLLLLGWCGMISGGRVLLLASAAAAVVTGRGREGSSWRSRTANRAAASLLMAAGKAMGVGEPQGPAAAPVWAAANLVQVLLCTGQQVMSVKPPCCIAAGVLFAAAPGHVLLLAHAGCTPVAGVPYGAGMSNTNDSC
jgi:hypothetical protein